MYFSLELYVQRPKTESIPKIENSMREKNRFLFCIITKISYNIILTHPTVYLLKAIG